jgi:DNA-binding CsgD family transcriptional regulator
MPAGHVADTFRVMSPPHGHLAFGTAPSAQLLAQVADALVWPLLLLQRDGGLLHANHAARQMLRRGQPLRLSARQQVQATPAGQQAHFAAALEAAFEAGPQQLLQWPGFTATLTRLPPDGPHEAPVLLALATPDGRASDARAFAAMHRLSEAETRVLQRLALGESSSRAAVALGVTPATVRSQTMSLRRKTGHASVAELLRALAAMPPLGPPMAPGN